MIDERDPDPDFARFLEWQLRRELRRRARFGSDPETEMRPNATLALTESLPFLRRAGVLLIALLSLFVGTAAGVVGERLTAPDDEADVELLLARADLELELARRRLALMQDSLARLEALAAQGSTSELEVARAHAEATAAEVELQRLESRREEVSLARREPRDELWAPAVEGRDFVSERLALDEFGIRDRIENLSTRLEWTLRLFESGFVSDAEIGSDRLALQLAERELDLLAQRLALRADFLAGKVSERELQLRELIAARRSEEQQLSARLEQVTAGLERTRRLVEMGLMSTLELDADELELVEVEGLLEVAHVELALLERELESVRAAGEQGPKRRDL